MTTSAAIIVDSRGLARKLADRPKVFIIHELLQNAWDENVTTVRVKARMLARRSVCEIHVEDDSPTGFADLASIYTMFRDSKKASDPEKRGRFEMGEKLVIALATRATIITTKGSVIFEGGTRKHSPTKRERGSLFMGEFRMGGAEFEDMQDAIRSLIVPSGIETYYNDELIKPRTILHTVVAPLPTIIANEQVELVTRTRTTGINVYEVRPGETASIYEMGIPIVETGDRWHYDVLQRVPVNFERNNVPPSYLRTLRVAVLNATSKEIGPAGASAPWVTDAINDRRVTDDAVREVVRGRFGDKAVIYDPSDLEGTKIAISRDYTVVPGGTFSKEAWSNIRRAEALLPAGKVTPSPQPYDPNGHPERVLPHEQWTDNMIGRATFAHALFFALTHMTLQVEIVTEPNVGWTANFGPITVDAYRLCLNYGRLGAAWFLLPHRDGKVLELLLHEFAHMRVDDHLSNRMHEEVGRLGALMTNLALDNPRLFR